MPHHVTQRGNRRQQTFFCDDDYRAYLDLPKTWGGRYGVRFWPAA
jgi:putative transposase